MPSSCVLWSPLDPHRPQVFAAGLYQAPVSSDSSFIRMRPEARPPEPVSFGAVATAADVSHPLSSLQPLAPSAPDSGTAASSPPLPSPGQPLREPGRQAPAGAGGRGGVFLDAAAMVLLNNSLCNFLHLSVGRLKVALIKVVERGWTCNLSLWSWVSPASHGEGVRLHTAVPQVGF